MSSQQHEASKTNHAPISESVRAMEPDLTDASVSTGMLCLEFVAIGRQLHRSDVEPAELEQRLGAWLSRFGLPSPIGGLTLEDLEKARALGEAVDAVARALMTSTTPDASDIRLVNEFADRATPVFFLRRDGRQRVAREENDTAAAFSVIARDAINVFGTADLRRLRSCAGCDLLFYDRSPSGRRRWCSMKRCGERAASALYRQRHATHATAAEVR